MFGMVPFDQHDVDLFNSFDSFARDFFHHNNTEMPAFRTDIRDNGDSYLLEAELPGFDKSDITLDVKDNVLTIKASRNESKDEKDEKGNYLRRERRYGSFTRSFDVTGIDENNISAAYINGVLKLTLPKEQPVVPATRRIEIA